MKSSSKSSLNLMSQRARNREQLRGCWRLWSRVFAVLIAVLCAASMVQWQVCQREAARQTAAEARCETIRELKNDNKRLRKQIEVLSLREQVPLALSKDQPLLGLLGLVAQEMGEIGDKAYVQQLQIQRDPLGTLGSSEPMLTFSMQGEAIDSGAITQLADSLRETGPFASVQLTSSNMTVRKKQAQQTFSLQGTY